MRIEDYDFSTFWDDSEYALTEYADEQPSDELIQQLEKELGYKLPASYIWLMKQHNGGIPLKLYYPCKEVTHWTNGHITIAGIMGIGTTNPNSISGEYGSQFMIEQWGYPNIGIAICDCFSAGHDMIFLDYRACGPTGEPDVVHINQALDYKITKIADSFEDFICGLVDDETLNTQPEDFMERLQYWHIHNEYQKIINCLSAIPARVLNFDLTNQLGRALNNIGRYDEAIHILQTVSKEGKDDALWNFRMGYAYYFLFLNNNKRIDNLTSACIFSELAVQLGDTKANWLLDACKEEIQAFSNKNKANETTSAIPELLRAMITYLDCHCHYFAPMKDDDPIMKSFQEASKRGKIEGFTPILLPADETLWETLMINSNNEKEKEHYTFDKQKVSAYRDSMRTQSLITHDALFAPMIVDLKNDAEENKLNWEKHILGEQKDGDSNNRFLSYWNYSTEMTIPLILAEIPTAHPWEIFAWLPFGGWNECPNTQDLMAITKSWYESYGAIPAVLTHDELEFQLTTPVNKQDAMQLALEQYAFCPDVIEQGPENATVGRLADTLSKSLTWYFWWD